jgi:endoglycosylceramidase
MPTPKNKYHIKDTKGRTLIYHGLNVSNFSKHNGQNFYLPWQTDEDYKKLNEWGFNLVRFLIFWHAAEPLEGAISQTYFDKVIEQINKLKSLGIDVVIDLHQDLYGPVPELNYTGNGFPAWTANTNNEPFIEQAKWSDNYLQPAMLACYSNFWKSESLQAKYVEFVKKCYTSFDSLSNVVGFDLMNEPFPALPSNIKELTTTKELYLIKETSKDLIKFERETLPKFYDKIQKMVLENRFRKPIWFEPAIWTSSGIPSILNFKPNIPAIFTPHYYDLKVHEGKPYSKLAKKIMKQEIKGTLLNAKKFKTPIVFGEFGAPSTSEGYLDYLNDFLTLTDKSNISWIYFTYDNHPFGVLTNGEETQQLKKLIRIYPRKIAGSNFKFNTVDNCFTLTYNHTLDCNTEIFIPETKAIIIKINDKIIRANLNDKSRIFGWNQKGKTKIEITYRE